MPTERSKSDPPPRLRRLRIFAPAAGLNPKRLLAEADGNNLARWLSALPPNRLDASGYRQAATDLARREGWKVRFLDEKSLARKGAGAFLAVSQGNATRDAGILHIRYRPAKVSGRPPLALVGKGICFDTGGNNLKPHKSMLDMHEDMAGKSGPLIGPRQIREFLRPYFDSVGAMNSMVFLKGYQWPFDPQKIENLQSSLIDFLIFNETRQGRRVFIDFLHNSVFLSLIDQKKFSI